MHAKLVGLLLSGVLVLPVCLTGVVTAFQFHASGEEIGDDAILHSNDVVANGEAASDETVAATLIVPAAPGAPTDASELAISNDEINADQIGTDTAQGTVPAPPAPGLDATPDTAEQLLHNQKANREYFVRLTVDGLLPGRLQIVDGRSRGLFPAKRVTISFVQAGKVISQARPGIDGFFQAAGLQPGFYTVVASGQDGVLTFGVEIQPALIAARNPAAGRAKEDVRMQIDGERFRLRQTESEDARDAQSFLRIDAVLVPPRDIPVVKRIMQPYLSPYLSPRGIAPRHGIYRPMTSSTTRVISPRAVAPRTVQLVAEKIANSPPDTIQGSWGSPLRLPVFYMHSNGTIGGRVTKLAPDIVNRDVHFRIPLESGSVYFVRNGAVVDQASVDQHGRFMIGGMRVGDYTLVAAGPAGVAAFGVSVMPHAPDSVNRTPGNRAHGATVQSVSSIRLVQQSGAGQGDTGMSDQDVDVDTSDPNDVSSQNMFDDFGDGEPAECGGGGGFAGGGGGGGGGFGGGGGLGLLGLGGLAGLAGLSGNNSGNGGPIASTGTPH